MSLNPVSFAGAQNRKKDVPGPKYNKWSRESAKPALKKLLENAHIRGSKILVSPGPD
jgi:hypothetical protein